VLDVIRQKMAIRAGYPPLPKALRAISFTAFFGETGSANLLDSYERGTLRFSGLLSFAVEPPRDLPLRLNKGLWVTSDGSLPDSRVNISISLPTEIPENAFCHYFFASDTNSFLVVAATEATFEWSLTGRYVVERVLASFLAQVEPVGQQVHARHALEPHRGRPFPALG
jgi:hypothetical protein